jgi:hypothetical protein
MGVLTFRIGNQLPSAATLYPRRTDTKTTDAAAVDAAWLTETTYEWGLSSDVTFNLLRPTFSYRKGEWSLTGD